MAASSRREPEIRRPASRAELEVALEIRRRVFVDEQKIPADIESDGKDSDAVHLVALEGDRVVATARLRREGAEGDGVIARVAVLPEYRGRSLGTELVRRLEREAAAAGLERLVLYPHAYLERFYSKLGYRTIPGSDVIVAGHPLIAMEKSVAG
jgi:predicted GNAT family N-acyltransferase